MVILPRLGAPAPDRAGKILVAALAAVLAGGAACQRDRSPLPPSPSDPWACVDCNVVVISLTNTRRDHLGAYGYQRDTSPNIDAFFKGAVRFERAYAPASWTLPVIASLMTSQFPTTHRVMQRDSRNRLPDDATTLVEILQGQGFKTAGFTGGGDHNRVYNIAQGFDFYLDDENFHEYGIGSPSAGGGGPMRYGSIQQPSMLAIDWLKKHRRDRFFVWLQGYDTHCPFTPPPPFDDRFDPDYRGGVDFSRCLWNFVRTSQVFRNGEHVWPVRTDFDGQKTEEVFLSERDLVHMIALYDGEISAADFALASFFSAVQALGLLDNTIFVFMAEHGDLFGEHGRFMRGGPLRGTFYEPVLNFPLLLRHPKRREPRVVDGIVQTVDLMPSLLEMLGIKDPAAAQREGKSFLPALRDPDATTNEFAFAGATYTACRNVFFAGTSIVQAVRDQRWKLIREALYDVNSGKRTSLTYELYDLGADPGEELNVYFEQRAQADRLEALLLRRFGDPIAAQVTPECRPPQPPTGK